ncbi:hypothetical protein [Jeotgalibacillus marinus]|uniref:Uncharacterized protein n=1 Tax=Jeotgalibacillus marinus TaxID=86667 RepID=A0ABV3Q3H1_9BACL
MPAIRDEVIRRLKRGKASSLQEEVNDMDELDFHHVLEALDRKDPLCLEVVKEAAHYFGMGLTNLIFLFQPNIESAEEFWCQNHSSTMPPLRQQKSE